MGSNYIRKPLMAFPLEQLQPQTIQPRIPEISIHINEMIFFKVGIGLKVLKVKYKYFEKFKYVQVHEPFCDEDLVKEQVLSSAYCIYYFVWCSHKQFLLKYKYKYPKTCMCFSVLQYRYQYTWLQCLLQRYRIA